MNKRDICDRLRAGHKYSGMVDNVEVEAAEEIERLRKELADLKGTEEKWTPHFEFHDQSRWPPRSHPLYSMFHGCRLFIQNDDWNYRKALEYAEMCVSDKAKKDS